jgi:predicted nuclease of predicted toxin-antitoxin system
MSPQWVQFLRDAGHQAEHWTSIGDTRATDREIADYAAQHGMVVITRDLDFGALLAASAATTPSVLQLRGPNQFPNKVGLKIIRLLDLASDSLESGAFVTTNWEKTRIRILPLGR